MTKDEVKKLRMNSPESLQFLNNATKFYNLMMMYRCAIREIQTKLEVLDDEFSVENNRNPISFIKTRIKKPNSIYNKLQKMGHDFTTENIQTYLNDVAGVRIVCAFIDDIYMISDLITQQDDIKVIEVKDYIKNPKPNGYRSYHMIVEIPVFFAKGKTPMRVELQIRTNGMDFWATLEHQLRYKKGIEEMSGYEEISEELLHSARVVCIFRKNCASVPEERSAVPLQTEQSSAGLLVTIIYSAIPARKFKTICLGGHSA